MTNEPVNLPEHPKRSLLLRILFGFLWFVAFYFFTNILVGGIVGGIAGASTSRDSGAPKTFSQSYEAGKNVGHQASVDFFHKYGLLILMAQILLFAVLCFFAVLPGVGRYKKLKKA